MFMRARVLTLAVLALLFAPGCPTGPGDPNDPNDPNDSNEPGQTGIRVAVPAGAEADSFDIFAVGGSEPLEQAKSMGEVVETDPGTYRLTMYFNEAFVLAERVEVLPGQVTVVTLGALRVTTAAGSELAVYDIYAADDDTLLQRPNDSDLIVPVPPGTYRLREYFNEVFVYADEVVVAADEIATVPLGSFELTTPAGSRPAPFDVFSPDGTTLLARPKSENTRVPLPPGDYRIMEYFNDMLVYTDVSIAAGVHSTFAMGAVRYTGPESSYDIYDATGTMLRVRPASMGDVRPLPPGSYVLKEYFDDGIIGAATVTAGQVTVTP